MILGAGEAGEVIARNVATLEGVSRLTLADVRKERLRAVAKRIERDMIALPSDLDRPEDVRAACKGADIIVNATMPDYNLRVMREAIRNRAHYVDLASEGDPDPLKPSKVHQQLALDRDFRKVQRVAVLGMGVAPGMTNLLTGYGSEDMDHIESVRIRVFGSGYTQVEDQLFAPLFSPLTFLEEVLWPAPVWKGDHIENLEPVSNEEIFLFPRPMPKATCYNVNNEECETMPTFIGKGIRFIDFKYAIAPARKALLEGLYRLGLTSTHPIRVGRTKIAPMDLLVALLPDASALAGRATGHTCVVVELAGSRNGVRRSRRLWTAMSHDQAYAKMGVHATAFLTGTPPSATVDALLHDEIRRRGVTTGGGLRPRPVLKRARGLGVPMLEGESGATRGHPLDLGRGKGATL